VAVGETDAPARRRSRFPGEIWVLVAGSFLIAVGFGLVAPAIPVFATSFHVGYTAASVVVSAFAFMRLASAPFAGRLVTRFGERPIYLYGVAIVAAGSLACAFAEDYWQLLLFRALSGAGSVMFSVSAIGLLIRISPPELRGRASGLFGTSFVLGGITGPVVGGGLLAVSLRAPFLVYGFALLIVVALVWVLLRRSTLAARVPGEPASALTFRAALGHPSYRAALFSNFTNGWVALSARASLIPLFVTSSLHQPDSFAAFALAVFAAGDALTLLLSGRLADSRGRRPMMIAGLGLIAVGTLLLGLSGEVWLALVASLVAGIGAGTYGPALNATIADVLGAKARGGSVLAGFQMSADIGSVLGPLVAGALAEDVSFEAAFGLSAVVAVLAMLTWLPTRETLPTGEPTSDDEQDPVHPQPPTA
jgi:DHA1 family tetracycline resistance protein-like MFS transporter